MVAVPDLLTIARREDGSVDEPLYLGIQKQLVDLRVPAARRWRSSIRRRP